MIYVINNNYYIKVGRKFIKVNTKINNKDVDLIPDIDYAIENDGKVKFSTIDYAELKKRVLNHDKLDEKSR